ncbi:hypothetical protein PISMIDRAFT_677970 [Pisolithus microcarpus 441]|uniref:Uncharacterized protein n=1 Tax=Pisolithus microcarpus 441 TaxID=765257 RepID=A0A0C9ZRG6_9AGAM|nr:hypothetical protein PISMIDRAFT_677970 [Pisolithus microcarpus 441]
MDIPTQFLILLDLRSALAPDRSNNWSFTRFIVLSTPCPGLIYRPAHRPVPALAFSVDHSTHAPPLVSGFSPDSTTVLNDAH